ncbi:MAG: GH116 family glycosyl-hydrolase [Thermoguttaceae bacterium]|nr:GH116 family glycosyl-hydrolase [Thermoguttaceae bacterium]
MYQDADRIVWRFGKGDVWDRRLDLSDDPKPAHISEIAHGIRVEGWKCPPYGGPVEATRGTANAQRMKELCQGAPPSYVKRPYPCPKPVGELALHLPADQMGLQITQSLVIEEATLHLTCAWPSGVRLDLDCFIPPSPNVLVVRWQLAGWNAHTRTGHDVPPVRFSLYRWADPSIEVFGERFAGEYLHEAFRGMGRPKVTPLAPPSAHKEGDFSWIEQAFPPDPLFKDGFRYRLAPWASGCRVQPVEMKAGGEARLQILPAATATNGTVIVAVATSSDRGGPGEELARIGKAVAANAAEAVQRWSEANRQSAAEFWARSRLQVSDPLIENCWYETLHARRCAYRHDTVPPGLFLPSTVQDYAHWHGDYHLNYNFQEPFWGDYTANHIELGDAYFRGMEFLLQIGRKIARDYYGCRGVFIQLSGYPIHAVDDPLGVVPMGRMAYMTGWAANQYWWRYLYTLDTNWLRTAGYPVIRDCALFYTDFMRQGDDGLYHVFPSNQGEDGFTGNPKDYTDRPQVMQHLRYCLRAAILASEVLQTDADLRAQWRERLEHCAGDDGTPPLKLTGIERICHEANPPEFGFGRPYRPQPDKPTGPPWPSEPTTWYFGQYPWAVMGRLREGQFVADRDFPVFRDIIRRWRHPNGLLWGMAIANYGRAGAWTESLGVIAPLQEMMLQSWDGALRIFPAWPRTVDARFENFRAEGAFLVSAAWSKGRVQSLDIVSQRGARCRLYSPWPEGAKVTDDAGSQVTCGADAYGRLEFATEAGKRYRLFPARNDRTDLPTRRALSGTAGPMAAASILAVSAGAPLPSAAPARRDRTQLFPTDLPHGRWLRFQAAGFSEPACGVLYRLKDKVTNGLPLGGIDTGCFDLETSGLLGYVTIYNTLVPRRGPDNWPLLGISIGGKTWVLCDRTQAKTGWGEYQYGDSGKTFRYWKDKKWDNSKEPLLERIARLNLDGVQTAREIHYWGHYPVADLEFETDAPISVGLRAWSPFLPGALVDSMLPGAVFEVRLRNRTHEKQQGALACSFPGPKPLEAGSGTYDRQHKRVGEFTGVHVQSKLASYALGVIGSEEARFGGGLRAEGRAWSAIASTLPAAGPDHPDASVAVDFTLKPGEERIVRFVVTWCAPTWNAGGYHGANADHTFAHMYPRHYPSALAAAEKLSVNHARLLERILAWQQVVYTEKNLPEWLRESLVNVLHLITETGMWAQAGPPLPDWVRAEDGLFGMNECPRGCPQIECIPCSFYGNQPVVYFFPELALSTLRGYKAYTSKDGVPPWIFGGCTGQSAPIDFNHPTRGYQWASNGISVTAMVDRFLMCHDTPDRRYLREFYPVVKQWMIWTVGLRKTPSYTIGERVIAMPDSDQGESLNPPTEWFEAAKPGWAGMTAHLGALRLAQLRITQRMAQRAGDVAFAAQCEEWIKAGAAAMEHRLWTTGPKGGYYLNYFDPETGRKSDYIFGYQMDGEWITDHHGLPGALPPERVRAVLETIRQVNIGLSKSGAVNYAKPDGTPYAEAEKGTWDYGAYSYFPPEALMLAMTYMYEGQREFGIEVARRCWENIVCRQGYTWDMPNIMRGDTDTGERTFGNDYYQNLMLWSLPAAVTGQDFAGPARPGGLVARIIRAARPDTVGVTASR